MVLRGWLGKGRAILGVLSWPAGSRRQDWRVARREVSRSQGCLKTLPARRDSPLPEALELVLPGRAALAW